MKTKYFWLNYFGWRSRKHQDLAHGPLPYLAAVLETGNGTWCRVVSHTLYQMTLNEILYEDFFKLYRPDITITNFDACKIFLKDHCEWMPFPVKTDELLLAKSENPTFDKLPKMRIKSRVPKDLGVFADNQNRACLRFEVSDDGVVTCLPLKDDYLEIEQLDLITFEKIYCNHLEDICPQLVCMLYVQYAAMYGISDDAREFLAQSTYLYKEDHDMMTNGNKARVVKMASDTKKDDKQLALPMGDGKADAPKAEATKAPVKSPLPKAAGDNSSKKAPAAKAPAAKTPAAKAPEKKPAAASKKSTAAGEGKAADKDGKPSASTMFKKLLLEDDGKGVCKHTDDEIFKQVKAKFNLEDKKRAYVTWYRNDLTKKGVKVPKKREA